MSGRPETEGVSASSRFPFKETLSVSGSQFTSEQVIETLEEFVSPERREKMLKVIDGRSFTIVPVLDRIFDVGNINAVKRSSEALGYQSIHHIVSPGGQTKRQNRISRGADVWLDIHRHPGPRECIDQLKQAGYRIAATHLDSSAVPIQELDFSVPTALVFGNEHGGVAPELLEASDLRCIIPMAGFTQSFNISVAAAISLYHVHRDRVIRLGKNGDLSEVQKRRLLAEYYLRSCVHAEAIFRRRYARN